MENTVYCTDQSSLWECLVITAQLLHRGLVLGVTVYVVTFTRRVLHRVHGEENMGHEGQVVRNDTGQGI